MLSVTIWRINRLRPAPSAARMAISFWRVTVRASRRFERLAQTISITTPTAQASTSSAVRRRPVTCSSRGTILGRMSLRSGYSRGQSLAERVQFGARAPTVAPGFRRPMTATVFPQRLVSGVSGKGK